MPHEKIKKPPVAQTEQILTQELSQLPEAQQQTASEIIDLYQEAFQEAGPDAPQETIETIDALAEEAFADNDVLTANFLQRAAANRLQAAENYVANLDQHGDRRFTQTGRFVFVPTAPTKKEPEQEVVTKSKRPKRKGSSKRKQQDSTQSYLKIDPELAEGWQPLHIGEVVLRPEVHYYNGQMAIWFSTNERRRQHGVDGDARIIFNLEGREKGARLAGLSLPGDLRGDHAGIDLLDHALKGLQAKDIPFNGTDEIRKPGISKMLIEAGLVAESARIATEIMPWKRWTHPTVPDVIVRRGAEIEQHKRRTSQDGKHVFYRVIDDPGRPIDITRVVPLHTRFNEPVNRQVRAQHRE